MLRYVLESFYQALYRKKGIQLNAWLISSPEVQSMVKTPSWQVSMGDIRLASSQAHTANYLGKSNAARGHHATEYCSEQKVIKLLVQYS